MKENVTLAVAEPSEAQRRALTVYFENHSEVELCGCFADGRQLLSALHQGLRPEAVVLDVSCDNALSLVWEIRHAVPGYFPVVALTIHSNTLLNDKMVLTSGADCVILKPYDIPGLLQVLYRNCREDESYQEFLRRSAMNQCLSDVGAPLKQIGRQYLRDMFCEEERFGASCTNDALYNCVAKKLNMSPSGIRNALGRLAKSMWEIKTPAYCSLCERNGISLNRPMTEKELYDCVSEECRRRIR